MPVGELKSALRGVVFASIRVCRGGYRRDIASSDSIILMRARERHGFIG